MVGADHAPTTTTPAMTAEELAWLKAVTKLHKTIDKAVSATTSTSRAQK
jgi:hypothetical protein